MKRIIIVGLACGLIGFGIGYFQKVRETDEYIHVIQVNGTIIEGNFLSIGIEELKALNDLIFQMKGADYKILQVIVKSENEVNLTVGISDGHEPHPRFQSEIPMTVKKRDGIWTITEIQPASIT
ncbi:MAG: hypothetical protein ACSHYA_12660 [Opitutaceae bacterium]